MALVRPALDIYQTTLYGMLGVISFASTVISNMGLVATDASMLPKMKMR
jgi:hypothetical protein